MRIVSGIHKGRKIIAPKRLPVRPTTDRAKEALFQKINHLFCFSDLSVIDLFAGTGSISYEFASRGTTDITSVDKNLDCIKFIAKTKEHLEMPIHPVKSDAFTFLKRTPQKSDIIFADPPYKIGDEAFGRISALVFGNNILRTGGLLVIEHAKRNPLSHLAHYEYSKSYGNSTFSFFEHTTKIS